MTPAWILDVDGTWRLWDAARDSNGDGGHADGEDVLAIFARDGELRFTDGAPRRADNVKSLPNVEDQHRRPVT